MSVLVWVLRVIGMWFGLAVPVGIGIGRAIRTADQRTPEPEPEPEPDDATALVQPESWSQAAINEEFASLIPDMVTAEVFELDALINRRARGWLR